MQWMSPSVLLRKRMSNVIELRQTIIILQALIKNHGERLQQDVQIMTDLMNEIDQGIQKYGIGCHLLQSSHLFILL